MSSDSWEKRFDDVVKETEMNLAKIKGTLHYTPSKYNEVRLSHSPLREVISRAPQYKSTPNKTYQSQIWKQDDEMTKLRKQISMLEHSNTQYEQETKLLKSQVASLRQNVNKASPTAPRDMSREFEKFKGEIHLEIRRLKEELPHSDHAPDKEIHNMRKEMDNNRVRLTEDFQELRNDVEKLRSRLMTVELEVKSVMAESKDTNRKCQRLGNEMGHLSGTFRMQNKSTTSHLQSLSDNCAHLSIIRSSVSDLQSRLSSMESSNFGSMSRLSSVRNESATPASGRDSSNTRGSSYTVEQLLHRDNAKQSIEDLDISLDDLSILSDEDEITLDLSQLSGTTTTFKLSEKPHRSVAESISLAGDLITGISGMLSDEETPAILSD